jgi:hypothetical protein
MQCALCVPRAYPVHSAVRASSMEIQSMMIHVMIVVWCVCVCVCVCACVCLRACMCSAHSSCAVVNDDNRVRDPRSPSQSLGLVL